MTFAKRELQSIPHRGRVIGLPDPLHRHGVPPALHQLGSKSELPSAVAEAVLQAQREGYANIVIIGRTAAHCSRIAAALDRSGFRQFELATSASFKYQGGTVIAPIHLAKGIEFEVSMIVDVDRATYADTEFDGRLLYVALTRPLHALHLFWAGPLATFLQKAVETEAAVR